MKLKLISLETSTQHPENTNFTPPGKNIDIPSEWMTDKETALISLSEIITGPNQLFLTFTPQSQSECNLARELGMSSRIPIEKIADIISEAFANKNIKTTSSNGHTHTIEFNEPIKINNVTLTKLQFTTTDSFEQFKFTKALEKKNASEIVAKIKSGIVAPIGVEYTINDTSGKTLLANLLSSEMQIDSTISNQVLVTEAERETAQLNHNKLIQQQAEENRLLTLRREIKAAMEENDFEKALKLIKSLQSTDKYRQQLLESATLGRAKQLTEQGYSRDALLLLQAEFGKNIRHKEARELFETISTTQKQALRESTVVEWQLCEQEIRQLLSEERWDEAQTKLELARQNFEDRKMYLPPLPAHTSTSESSKSPQLNDLPITTKAILDAKAQSVERLFNNTYATSLFTSVAISMLTGISDHNDQKKVNDICDAIIAELGKLVKENVDFFTPKNVIDILEAEIGNTARQYVPDWMPHSKRAELLEQCKNYLKLLEEHRRLDELFQKAFDDFKLNQKNIKLRNEASDAKTKFKRQADLCHSTMSSTVLTVCNSPRLTFLAIRERAIAILNEEGESFPWPFPATPLGLRMLLNEYKISFNRIKTTDKEKERSTYLRTIIPLYVQAAYQIYGGIVDDDGVRKWSNAQTEDSQISPKERRCVVTLKKETDKILTSNNPDLAMRLFANGISSILDLNGPRTPILLRTSGAAGDNPSSLMSKTLSQFGYQPVLTPRQIAENLPSSSIYQVQLLSTIDNNPVIRIFLTNEGSFRCPVSSISAIDFFPVWISADSETQMTQAEATLLVKNMLNDWNTFLHKLKTQKSWIPENVVGNQKKQIHFHVGGIDFDLMNEDSVRKLVHMFNIINNNNLSAEEEANLVTSKWQGEETLLSSQQAPIINDITTNPQTRRLFNVISFLLARKKELKDWETISKDTMAQTGLREFAKAIDHPDYLDLVFPSQLAYLYRERTLLVQAPLLKARNGETLTPTETQIVISYCEAVSTVLSYWQKEYKESTVNVPLSVVQETFPSASNQSIEIFRKLWEQLHQFMITQYHPLSGFSLNEKDDQPTDPIVEKLIGIVPFEGLNGELENPFLISILARTGYIPTLSAKNIEEILNREDSYHNVIVEKDKNGHPSLLICFNADEGWNITWNGIIHKNGKDYMRIYLYDGDIPILDEAKYSMLISDGRLKTDTKGRIELCSMLDSGKARPAISHLMLYPAKFFKLVHALGKPENSTDTLYLVTLTDTLKGRFIPNSGEKGVPQLIASRFLDKSAVAEKNEDYKTALTIIEQGLKEIPENKKLLAKREQIIAAQEAIKLLPAINEGIENISKATDDITLREKETKFAELEKIINKINISERNSSLLTVIKDRLNTARQRVNADIKRIEDEINAQQQEIIDKIKSEITNKLAQLRNWLFMPKYGVYDKSLRNNSTALEEISKLEMFRVIINLLDNSGLNRDVKISKEYCESVEDELSKMADEVEAKLDQNKPKITIPIEEPAIQIQPTKELNETTLPQEEKEEPLPITEEKNLKYYLKLISELGIPEVSDAEKEAIRTEIADFLSSPDLSPDDFQKLSEKFTKAVIGETPKKKRNKVRKRREEDLL